jgi:hypothetical protein
MRSGINETSIQKQNFCGFSVRHPNCSLALLRVALFLLSFLSWIQSTRSAIDCTHLPIRQWPQQQEEQRTSFSIQFNVKMTGNSMQSNRSETSGSDVSTIMTEQRLWRCLVRASQHDGRRKDYGEWSQFKWTNKNPFRYRKIAFDQKKSQ